jgi:hypothetical protein
MPRNQTAFGVETDQTINESPSPALLDATRRGFAALLSHMGRSASSLHFHKTIAAPPGRKQDPWLGPTSANMGNWPGELNVERNRIHAIMGSSGGKPPQPTPGPDPTPVPTPTGDDKMYVFFKGNNGKICVGDGLTWWHIPDPKALQDELWRAQDQMKLPVMYCYDGGTGLKPVPTVGSWESKRDLLLAMPAGNDGTWGRNLYA